MKVFFQRTKKGDFLTQFYVWHLVVVAIQSNIFGNWSCKDLSSEKLTILQTLEIRVLGHSLINLYTDRVIAQKVFKRGAFIKLIFMGVISFKSAKNFWELFTKKLTSFNLNIVFACSIMVHSFFILENKLTTMLRSGRVSKYDIRGCYVSWWWWLWIDFVVCLSY